MVFSKFCHVMGESYELLPQGFWAKSLTSNMIAMLKCPICATVFSLSPFNYGIGEDGKIDTKIRCTKDNCSFFKKITLKGWNSGEKNA